MCQQNLFTYTDAIKNVISRFNIESQRDLQPIQSGRRCLQKLWIAKPVIENMRTSPAHVFSTAAALEGEKSPVVSIQSTLDFGSLER
jgi:hypothetical protein